MSPALKAFFSWMKRKRLQLFLCLLSIPVFVLLLFPFDDLGDFVSAQVGAATQNSVFVQFDRMNLSLFPAPGLHFENLGVEAANLPGLKAKEITVTPSLGALIKQRPFGHIDAKGLLRGDVRVSVSSGPRTEAGLERTKIEVSAEKLSLQDIRELAGLPVLLKGRVNLETTAIADLSWSEQPESEVSLVISQFELPPSNLETTMGPITLPEVKLSQVELKGKLASGRFLIERGQVGKAGDEVFGTVKGSFNMGVQNVGGRPVLTPGGYSLEVDLQLSHGFVGKASTFLGLLAQYKTDNESGSRIRVKVSANTVGIPPSFGQLR